VVTLWYRAPELLLNEKSYDEKVDIWSAGAVFGELLAGKPIFPGKDETQLLTVLSYIGTPVDGLWPGCERMENYQLLVKPIKFREPRLIKGLKEAFPALNHVSQKGLDLLGQLLAMNPAARPTASEALDHAYFWELEAGAITELTALRASLPPWPFPSAFDSRSRRPPPAPKGGPEFGRPDAGGKAQAHAAVVNDGHARAVSKPSIPHPGPRAPLAAGGAAQKKTARPPAAVDDFDINLFGDEFEVKKPKVAPKPPVRPTVTASSTTCTDVVVVDAGARDGVGVTHPDSIATAQSAVPGGVIGDGAVVQ